MCLRALKVKGKEIVVSGHTFLATLDAIVDAGAYPVLVDTALDYNIDVEKIEQAVKSECVGIMPVHLNGRSCDMDAIMDIAKRYNLFVLEDAAQGLGATYKGKMCGSWGNFSCFSFFPAKLLGTIGDAGAICTNDRQLADKLKAMRDYGRVRGQEQVTCYGLNSRLDNVHAAILNYKLKYLNTWILRRRDIANQYHQQLVDCLGVTNVPVSPNYDDCYYDTYQNYVIRHKYRDELIDFLIEKGIEILVHWRTPLNKQEKLNLGHFHLPKTQEICDTVISLPMYQELTDEQVKYVCDCIKEFKR
jgi:dTDP-4-amino-4,6-dideoxygalactose transaminase